MVFLKIKQMNIYLEVEVLLLIEVEVIFSKEAEVDITNLEVKNMDYLKKNLHSNSINIIKSLSKENKILRTR